MNMNGPHMHHKVPTDPKKKTRKVIHANQTRAVDFYVPDPDTAASLTFATAAKDLRNADKNDKEQVCSYFASMLCSIFPSLTETFTVALSDISAHARIINLPSEAGVGDNAVELYKDQELMCKPTILVMLGQCLIVLYKNFSATNFNNYMGRRVKALKARACCCAPVNNILIFDYVKANTIHQMLGNNHGVRVAVLNVLIGLSNLQTPTGMVCHYIYTLLSWIEMGALTFVMDELVSNESPVLEDETVSNEVVAFNEAAEVIMASEYPQFFRILASKDQLKLIERRRFPLLITVAVVIRREVYCSLKQYITPADPSSRDVQRLVDIHRWYMNDNTKVPESIRSAVDFLYSLSTTSLFTDGSMLCNIEERQNED